MGGALGRQDTAPMCQDTGPVRRARPATQPSRSGMRTLPVQHEFAA